jgi:hypothetical protein
MITKNIRWKYIRTQKEVSLAKNPAMMKLLML